MIKNILVFLLASIITISAFSLTSDGLAHAQNGPGTGFFQPPTASNEATPSANVTSEPCPSQESDEYWLGCSIGISMGSNVAPIDGASARDSGLEPDPANKYQPPTQQTACTLYQDAFGNPCDTSQQQFSNFMQGLNAGYQIGYAYGYMAGYFLDEVFPPQTQPGQQFPTQPGQQFPTQ